MLRQHVFPVLPPPTTLYAMRLLLVGRPPVFLQLLQHLMLRAVQEVVDAPELQGAAPQAGAHIVRHAHEGPGVVGVPLEVHYLQAGQNELSWLHSVNGVWEATALQRSGILVIPWKSVVCRQSTHRLAAQCDTILGSLQARVAGAVRL